MPVYEYECEECGERSSHLIGLESAEAAQCSSCGATQLRRLISSFSSGRNEPDRIAEASAQLANASDENTGEALAEVGRAYDEDLSETMTTMFEQDQEGT